MLMHFNLILEHEYHILSKSIKITGLGDQLVPGIHCLPKFNILVGILSSTHNDIEVTADKQTPFNCSRQESRVRVLVCG